MLTTNNKRILRNTGMLYVRMLIAMAVGLYTSRVVLQVLGVEDFGTYHVIAGFVALLGFMQGAMITATQRYFAFDLGQNNGKNLRALFNTSIQIHALLAICIICIAETVGYWFVSTQLTVPQGRINSALLTFHLSVTAFAVGIITVPLSAMLMANERMGLFALMSIMDVLLKLVAVLVLPYLAYDKLSTYAALLLGIALVTFSGYLLIGRAVFPAARLQWYWNSELFRSMLGFTAWNTWGNLAAAMSEHGNNVLLNIFFGPAVNAGRGVATQASGALNQLVTNVQAAVNPQIVKLYASGKHHQMHELVQRASRYNFLLLITLSMPVFVYAKQLLNIWLITPPNYSELFLKLTIIMFLIDSISRPLMTSAQATGKIRLYQSVIGGILLLNVPMAFAALNMWGHPVVVAWSGIAVALIALIARLFILNSLTGMVMRVYVTKVIFRVAMVGFFAGLLNEIILIKDPVGLVLLLGIFISLIITMAVAYIFGVEAREKRLFFMLASEIYRKLIV
jgi:O-antigen/teichoic acid export membrane protein